MADLTACAFCGEQPERMAGDKRLYKWWQIRCRNVLCTEHGTRKHLTETKAERLWNIRQAQHKNILASAAKSATQKGTA